MAVISQRSLTNISKYELNKIKDIQLALIDDNMDDYKNLFVVYLNISILIIIFKFQWIQMLIGILISKYFSELI